LTFSERNFSPPHLGEADLIVGTSAGALAGAPLAGGMLDRAVALYQRSRVPFFRALAEPAVRSRIVPETRISVDAHAVRMREAMWTAITGHRPSVAYTKYTY
jgi:predicted acylesterase/phospholipase RssA